MLDSSSEDEKQETPDAVLEKEFLSYRNEKGSI